jgi:hypothetical protein
VTKVLRLASTETIFYKHPEISTYGRIKLQDYAAIAVIFFVFAARALLCGWRLELGGVGINGSKDRRIFPIILSTGFTSEQVERVQNHRQQSGL